MSKRPERRIRPIPGLLRPGEWDIRSGDAAKTAISKRIMTVPLAPGEKTRQIQLHEMAHNGFSEVRGPSRIMRATGASENVVQGAEDFRINEILSALGMPRTVEFLGAVEKYKLPGILRSSIDSQVSLLAASFGTPDGDTIRECADPYIVARVDEVLTEASESLDVFEYSTLETISGKLAGIVRELKPTPTSGEGEGEGDRPAWARERDARREAKAAKEAKELLSPARHGEAIPEDAPKPKTEAEKIAEDMISHDERSDATASTREVVESMEAVARKLYGAESGDPAERVTKALRMDEIKEGELNGKENAYGGIEGGWIPLGEPKILPRTEKLPAGRIPKGKRKMTDAGAIPTAMHRLTIDGRPFAGPKLKEGTAGAVLIDISGSMRLTPEELETIILTIPAGITAVYSGKYFAVVAKRGRMISKDTLYRMLSERPGTNESDGPALRWLANQRGPRFWICDGVVTYAGDRLADEKGRAECIQICVRHRILRCRSVEEVVARYGKRARRRTGK